MVFAQQQQQQQNYFAAATMLLEFPRSGGIVPSTDFSIVKLDRYQTAEDYRILPLEILAVIFFLFYIYAEGKQMYMSTWSYFSSLYNYMDMIVIGVCALCCLIVIYCNSLNGFAAGMCHCHDPFRLVSRGIEHRLGVYDLSACATVDATESGAADSLFVVAALCLAEDL